MKTTLRNFLGVGLAAGWLGVTAMAAEGQPTDDQVRQLYNLPPTNAAPAVVAPDPSAAAPDPASTAANPTPAPPAPVDLGAKAPAPAEDEDIQEVLTIASETPIQSAIQLLARQAGLNVFVDPKVLPMATAPDGKQVPVTIGIRWEKVTARQALDELLDIHKLQLQLNKNTKIYRVVAKPEAEPMFTQVFQLKFANPTNMVLVVSNSFTKARAIQDTRTSQMVITATEKDLESISNLIGYLDLPTKQVLIEAQIYETTKNPSTVKGIDWSGTLEAQTVTFGNGNTAASSRTDIPGGTTTSTTPGGRPVSTTAGSSTTSSAITTLNPASGLVGFTANTARGLSPATAFLNADGAKAVLSFLNKETDSEVLSTPKAVTMDNMPATLEVTRAFPIFEITPGSANSPAGSTVTYTNMGTILTVTPRISANKTVALKVVPEVSSIDSKDRQVINGQVNEANVYAIRRIEANVLVPSGSTLVMGGLISDSTSASFTKVPILGDIPFLGRAFRHEGKSRNKANLLIFVTPTIVEESDYMPTKSTFLQTRPVDMPEMKETPYDSAKPHDWTKPVP